MKRVKSEWYAVIRNPAQGAESDCVCIVNKNTDPHYRPDPSYWTVSSCGNFTYWQENRVILGEPQLLTIEYDDDPEAELAILDEQEAKARQALEVALDAIKARRMELALLTYEHHDPE